MVNNMCIKKYTINRNGREFCIREYVDNIAIISTWSENKLAYVDCKIEDIPAIIDMEFWK